MAPVLHLHARFSRYFLGAIVFMHGGALMITLFLPVSLLLRFSICLLLLSAAARALRMQRAPEILLLFGDYVQFEDGREARIARYSFVHPALVVLCLEGGRARVLFADALDKDQFRRLRVYLRHALDVTENDSFT